MRMGSPHVISGAVAFTAGTHLLMLGTTPGPDEGGYAMVARFANQPGPYLYGPQFVDRPPLLFRFFDLANHLGTYGTRVVALVAALITVLACARAAHLISGSRAAGWAAWVAAAITSSALLLAEQLNGEILAGMLVAVSIAAVLESGHRRSRPALALLFGLIGGATAIGALLVKQNFADALAFVIVLCVVGVIHGKRPDPMAVIGYLLGAGLMVAWVADWAHDHGGLHALLYAMYGVRAAASGSIAGLSLSTQLQNASSMLAAGIGSGVLLLGAALVVAFWRRPRTVSPLLAGYLGALAVELVGIVGGGNFAQHYLIGLAPTLSVGAGVAIARLSDLGTSPMRLQWLRRMAAFVVAAVVIANPAYAAVDYATANSDAVIATWLRSAAAPGDSVSVPFTNAQVIDLSGLRPGYPFSWSLLVRTRDPHLVVFLRALRDPAGPTWVVVWNDPGSLGLTPTSSLSSALAGSYRLLGELCGHQIWLRDGHRAARPLPSACA